MNLFENLQIMNENTNNSKVYKYKDYTYVYEKDWNPYYGECGEYNERYMIYDKNNNYVCSCSIDKNPEKVIDELVKNSTKGYKRTLEEVIDKPIKVSNKNYKRTLKEINDVISSVSKKELIPTQCNEIIEDIYYKVIELKNMFNTELENKSIEELKDAIHLAYMNTRFEDYIEKFVSSHGVSPDSETIFDGMSDENVIELYDDLRDALIKYYGPDYDELNSGVYDAFNLMI